MVSTYHKSLIFTARPFWEFQQRESIWSNLFTHSLQIFSLNIQQACLFQLTKKYRFINQKQHLRILRYQEVSFQRSSDCNWSFITHYLFKRSKITQKSETNAFTLDTVEKNTLETGVLTKLQSTTLTIFANHQLFNRASFAIHQH